MSLILSLFDFTGAWSQPYLDAGNNVLRIDLKRGIDILTWDYRVIARHVHGILAAPPCTDFAVSGAQYWKQKDADGRTQKGLELVDKMLEIINHFKPDFWAVEQPVGRLPRLRPALGAPWYFQPCDFGDPWIKKTAVFGKFNRPKKTPCAPVRACDAGSWLMRLGGKSERTKELRSATPPGFARAFFEANS